MAFECVNSVRFPSLQFGEFLKFVLIDRLISEIALGAPKNKKHKSQYNRIRQTANKIIACVAGV